MFLLHIKLPDEFFRFYLGSDDRADQKLDCQETHLAFQLVMKIEYVQAVLLLHEPDPS